MYDPVIGRFISQDPVKGALENPQSQNPYTYGFNNPVNFSDPSGEQVQFIQSCINLAKAGLTAISNSRAVQPALRGTQNPKVQQSIQKGMEKHQQFYAEEETIGNTANKAVFKDYGSLIRPDSVDFTNKIIKELKPQNSPAAQKQLEEYMKRAQEYLGGNWKGVLEFYNQ